MTEPRMNEAEMTRAVERGIWNERVRRARAGVVLILGLILGAVFAAAADGLLHNGWIVAASWVLGLALPFYWLRRAL